MNSKHHLPPRHLTSRCLLGVGNWTFWSKMKCLSMMIRLTLTEMIRTLNRIEDSESQKKLNEFNRSSWYWNPNSCVLQSGLLVFKRSRMGSRFGSRLGSRMGSRMGSRLGSRKRVHVLSTPLAAWPQIAKQIWRPKIYHKTNLYTTALVFYSILLRTCYSTWGWSFWRLNWLICDMLKTSMLWAKFIWPYLIIPV
jgi:hypothetical protein